MKGGAQKDKRPSFRLGRFDTSRRLPTLPHRFQCSTIGSKGLNCRVRNGNGWDPLDMTTEKTAYVYSRN